MHNILITGKLSNIALDILSKEKDFDIDYFPDLEPSKIFDIIEKYHCLISRSETSINKDLINKATNLMVIARAAVGVGNIDIEYATEKGILVLNTPGLNTNSAAELTIGLLLAVARKIPSAHLNMHKLKWERHHFTGMELRGKTIGIIGLGNVGHRVAKFALGFDMNVLAYDPYIPNSKFEQYKAEKTDLETLLKKADIITVHVPKTKETTAMIGEKEIGLMKKTAIVINAARGGIIKEDVLFSALESKTILGAGIDTWEKEPVTENPFSNLNNVVMTPHIGASTEEAQHAIGISIANQTIRALKGEIVDYPVNMPQMQVIEGSLTKKYNVLSEKLASFAAQLIEFVPNELELFHHGDFSEQDIELFLLSFLKGFLQHSTDEFITYVNAKRKATAKGLKLLLSKELQYTHYEKSIRFVLNDGSNKFQIAGVVFNGDMIRMTTLNEFAFEMEPTGTLLVTKNKDQPGMIGVIGTILGNHKLNIDEFALARNKPGGEAMALIRVDHCVSDDVIVSLKENNGILSVKRIYI